ncbi:hypothetical protein ACQKCU_10795 [Heyndrickxia sporothermodurans]
MIEKIFGFQYLYWGSSAILFILAIAWSITYVNKRLSVKQTIQLGK